MDPVLQRDDLSLKLTSMTPGALTTFAAAVATRLLPAYESLCNRANIGGIEELKAALEYVWKTVIAGSPRMDECDVHLERVMELIDTSSSYDSKFKLYAEDAAAAVAYTLRSIRDPKPDEAIWAAQRIYESLSRYVRAKENIHPIKGQPGIDFVKQISSFPIMQAEFSRQDADLNDLAGNPTESVIQLIKVRAESSPALPDDFYLG